MPSSQTLNRSLEPVHRYDRSDWIAGCVVAAATIPIVTSAGAIFIAEIILATMIIIGLFHTTKTQALQRLNTRLIAAGVLLLGYSSFQVAIGLGGPIDASAARLRSYTIFVAGLAMIALWRPHRTRVVNALTIAGVIVALLVVGEFATQSTWDARRAPGYFNPDTVRPLGPLGVGGTASLLLASFYSSIITRRWFSMALAVVAIVLLGSRAHMLGAVAAAVIALAMIAAHRGHAAIRQLAGPIAAITAAAAVLYLFMPEVLNRLQHLRTSRTQIWTEATAQWLESGWATIIAGVGPAGTSVDLGAEGAATFLHNQYLALTVEAGVVGLVVLAVLLAVLLSPTRRRDLPLVVGMLVACLFGEMLIGATPGLAIGAIAVYAVVFSTDDRSGEDEPDSPIEQSDALPTQSPLADSAP